MRESISTPLEARGHSASRRARAVVEAIRRAASEGEARTKGSPGPHRNTGSRRAGADDEPHGEPIIVAGNRAGIVSWVSPSWTRITGLELSETVDKPIGHFLTQARIELELVEFVGQRFLLGQSSSVQLPFVTADGRRVLIHLEVEPIRDDASEVCAFLAVARELELPAESTASAPVTPSPTRRRPAARTQRADTRNAPYNAPDAAPDSLDDPAGFVGADLSAVAEEAVTRIERTRPPALVLDVSLSKELPPLSIDADGARELVMELLEIACMNVGEQPDFLTVLTGRLWPGATHVSPVYPVATGRIPASNLPRVFLEIHDTGPTNAHGAPGRKGGRHLHQQRREQIYLRARRLAETLGGALYVDGRPGCGTQALVVFPAT